MAYTQIVPLSNETTSSSNGTLNSLLSKSMLTTTNYSLSSFLLSFSSDLNCLPYTNSTVYDHLTGIQQRFIYPIYLEPNVAVVFHIKSQAQLKSVAKKLLFLKNKYPVPIEVYSLIGNYFRILGNVYQSIECFRCGLAIDPYASLILINLARIMYNLNHTNDTIYLIQQSIDNRLDHTATWLEHYVLGQAYEKLKQYSHACKHFQFTLSLKKHFQSALNYINRLNCTNNRNIKKIIQQQPYRENEKNRSFISLGFLLMLTCFLCFILFTFMLDNIITLTNDEHHQHQRFRRRFKRSLVVRSLKINAQR
ncbi:unnamed protein product [Didymodactylos carnosus]|uniref:Tetratricopeptide repeat protein n=1 Tax=Didymodactylos carnosus TaxID=1234261 RepID=A0A814F527_9BILA|nr:unnamed protein product [Didymodactylos carnosus]CAF0976699.1 unnamed protein product [Didymodactylos carnosus]CAF3571579.1 unnamed protein product [Didymodactylos carnosus]CAF3749550.1 unnamed protein product [Didymodactylos carnosus]